MTPPEVPGFDLSRRLGRGGSCEVWLARERDGLRRPVALKVFARAPEAYRRELDAVRQVEEVRREARCPWLVQSLATGEAGDVAFIAFEVLEGTLQDKVEQGGPLPFADAVECARQAGEALALLHVRGLFHRDVKPGNLLLGADGRVRLADFGLSRPLDGTLSAAGSPAFAAPEVIAGRPTDGRRVDVYSLGATLAWLLTGETMLPGRPDVFLLERHGVPRPLQRAIVRAMTADPTGRWPTVEAFLAALKAEAEAEVVAAPAADSPPDSDLRPALARAIVERHAYAAAAATSLPLPGSEWLAVLPLHVRMIGAVGAVYGCAFERREATALLARINGCVERADAAGRAAATVVKLFLPGVGAVAGAAQAHASTIALGSVVIAFFERDGDLPDAAVRAVHRDGLAAARGRYDPARAEAEDADLAALRRTVERLARVDHLLASGLISEADHATTSLRILAEADV